MSDSVNHVHSSSDLSVDESNTSAFSLNVPASHTSSFHDNSTSNILQTPTHDNYLMPVSANTSMVSNAESVNSSAYTQAAPASIVIRALIITSDASVIIGKQGRHINEIRELSNARLNISESIPSNPERILTVSGPLDAVSKAFGLIVRRINDEPFGQPSLPGSRAAAIRFIIPNSRMGSIIGKQGSKIKEIQEASGARLYAGEAMLPGSTERILSITGVADALHIAVYYVGTILLEHPDRNSNNIPYRPTATPRTMGTPTFSPTVGSPSQNAMPFSGFASPKTPVTSALAPGLQTQQIFIPNDLVGCIIGKGGQKINEIRQLSASHIKIMERNAGIAAGGTGSERLVTITGPPPNIQMAVTLLYQRLEQEKLRLAQNGVAM
ncbi:pbp2-pab1 binding protein [Malassezia pachydermatis]|uniref:Pbp2-pab1 binding protein n=1 Tax=Malassezia pachydermatis TaxID=77020 RepID=A0A0M8MJG8_9BASI|nr:pbp2-pab1 binding protein [Malassezia pachydermatis]KOS12778.1 pbp2-pab1 binding protein [Malassezia pachydermatis]